MSSRTNIKYIGIHCDAFKYFFADISAKDIAMLSRTLWVLSDRPLMPSYSSPHSLSLCRHTIHLKVPCHTPTDTHTNSSWNTYPKIRDIGSFQHTSSAVQSSRRSSYPECPSIYDDCPHRLHYTNNDRRVCIQLGPFPSCYIV